MSEYHLPRTSLGEKQPDLRIQHPLFAPTPTTLPQHPAPCARPSTSTSPRPSASIPPSPVPYRPQPAWSIPSPRPSPQIPPPTDHHRKSSRQNSASNSSPREKTSERTTSDSSTISYGRSYHDVEKGSLVGSHHSSSSHSNIMTSLTYREEEEDEEPIDEYRLLQEQKATNILLFTSGPCVLLSFINFIWTIIALFLAILTTPFRCGAGKPSFGHHLSGLLGPALNRQLRCIYSPVPVEGDGPSYSAPALIGVHLLSPFLSFAMMFASWTLAVYWVSSAIVGDPAGQDKRDDGKETVLGLRNWWERWLMRSFKSA